MGQTRQQLRKPLFHAPGLHQRRRFCSGRDTRRLRPRNPYSEALSLLYGTINRTSRNVRYVHKEHVRRRGRRLRGRHPVKSGGPALKSGQCQWLFDAELHVLQGNHSPERVPESSRFFLTVRLPCLSARCRSGAGSHAVLDVRWGFGGR